MIRILAMLVFLCATPAQSEDMKLAVTTSFHNSGLADILVPVIKTDTGIDVQLLVVGTGQALRLGQAGDVDAILVHSKSAEQAFVTQGFGTHRREIMYNDFVFVGPATDAAGIAHASNAAEVLTRVANAMAAFVSRGDDSGTHKKERALWDVAGLNPDIFDGWYKEVGAGMGASLNTASALGAYVLSDRASWLNFGNKGDLELLFAGDPALFNQYAFLPVNPARHAHVNADAAAKLEDWLTSETAKTLINDYKIDGQELFVFNATAQ